MKLLVLAAVAVTQVLGFCRAFNITDCVHDVVKRNPGRQKRYAAIMRECGSEENKIDATCLETYLKKCGGKAVDIMFTNMDFKRCAIVHGCNCQKNSKTLLRAEIDCKVASFIDRKIDGIAAHCLATEPKRVSSKTGKKIKRVMGAFMSTVNQPEKLDANLEAFHYFDGDDDNTKADKLVFIDNQQVENHPMTGRFVGNEIMERTSGVAEDYHMIQSTNPKDASWVATVVPVTQHDFGAAFVGQKVLMSVYRNFKICKVSNGHCMTYPQGIFAAIHTDSADGSSITGLVHYSPWAKPYQCLETGADLKKAPCKSSKKLPNNVEKYKIEVNQTTGEATIVAGPLSMKADL